MKCAVDYYKAPDMRQYEADQPEADYVRTHWWAYQVAGQTGGE